MAWRSNYIHITQWDVIPLPYPNAPVSLAKQLLESGHGWVIVSHGCLWMYSSANKIFAVLRRNRSDPLSRVMGCIGELRAGSRSAGYERFGTGNLAPLAVLVPIPKPATHSKGARNQHPHCTVYIWMYHVGSHLIAVKVCTGQQVNSQTSFS